MSAPGQEKETNSWHLLCTTKLQTARKEKQVDVTVNPDIHIHFKKKISFIFIFSSLLDIRTLFEIYFCPCSINSRYMLQLPVLRHCFSSYKYNSHDLLLVLDIAQALAHLWANTVLMVSPFSIKHQNINKFLHLFQYLNSIAEMVYDELCWHLKHQKSPISKFIIISSKQFFLFSLSLSYYR